MPPTRNQRRGHLESEMLRGFYEPRQFVLGARAHLMRDAIRRNQTQSDAIRRNQTQSDVIRGRTGAPDEGCNAHAIRCVLGELRGTQGGLRGGLRGTRGAQGDTPGAVGSLDRVRAAPSTERVQLRGRRAAPCREGWPVRAAVVGGIAVNAPEYAVRAWGWPCSWSGRGCAARSH